MTLFLNFYLFFVPVSFATMMLIRWYALAFLYRDLSSYWSGLPFSLVLCAVLLTIVGIILHPIFSKFEKIIQKIKTEKVKPTEEEKNKCLGGYRKVCIAIWLTNFFGFFVGQFILLLKGIAEGRVELFMPRCTMVIVQCLACAIFTATVEIQVVNEMFSRRRKLLEIHTVNDFANRKSLNFSTSAIMLCFVSFLFIIINMMTVPFQIIAKPLDMASYDAVYIYMKEAVISGIVCFILCGSICFYIFHSFSKRIATNLHRVQDIAKEGNLTSRIELTMLDDYGALSGAINELIEKLASMINALKNDTDVVAEQSDTLSAVSEEANSALKQMITSFKKIEEGNINQNTLVDNAEKDVLALTEDAEHVKKQVIAQTSSVETASAAINEMSANIASVAEMTRKADTVSSALSQSSAEGNASLKGAVAAIAEIQKVSTEVEAIVKVIQAIASQTNLLSMNAAIEAAHAGEFGAGFAVVADEVRSLAQSSSNSAKDIQEKIKDMVGKINAGVDSINVAGKSFKDIEENVQATSELVKTIAAAMEEQRQGAEDTLRTTNELVNAIQSIKTLAESESERAENVRTVMLDVVSSSKNALEMVNEGVEASNHLNDAIEQVNDSVNSNRSAVSSMQGTVKGFRV